MSRAPRDAEQSVLVVLGTAAAALQPEWAATIINGGNTMPGITSEHRPPVRGRAARVRSLALAIVGWGGAFLAIGAGFDLVTDAAGRLPSDHSATFQAVTGITWREAASVAHPLTPYVARAEAGYAAFELLFGILVLIVAAIPLRRGERWAWWSCWVLLLAFAAFGTLFGVNDSANRWAAIAAGVLVAVALIALVPMQRRAAPAARLDRPPLATR
jgi:uncharacterized membrane protein